MTRPTDKSSLNHALDATRGVGSAASAIGAISIAYGWTAPWIVYVVDHWQSLSDFVFGWLPIDTTPESRLIATTFAVLWSLCLPIHIDLPSTPNNSRRVFYRKIVFTVIALIVITLSLFLILYIKIEITSTGDKIFLVFWIIVNFLIAHMISRGASIWLLVILVSAFIFDRLYRLGVPAEPPQLGM